MSSPQAPGASSPRPAGQLQDAMTTFSDAVFEAAQGLLNAQQPLLSGDGAHSEADVDKERSNGSDEQETDRAIADETDDETDELDAADETDELDAADETDVEPAAGQTGGDTGAAPAAKAGGRPRRARRPRTAAGTMTSGVN